MTLESNLPIAQNVGDELIATPYFEDFLYEISKVAAAIANATASSVSVTSANATDLPTVIILANETKSDLNALVSDLNAAITKLNEVLTNLRAAGKIDE